MTIESYALIAFHDNVTPYLGSDINEKKIFYSSYRSDNPQITHNHTAMLSGDVFLSVLTICYASAFTSSRFHLPPNQIIDLMLTAFSNSKKQNELGKPSPEKKHIYYNQPPAHRRLTEIDVFISLLSDS